MEFEQKDSQRFSGRVQPHIVASLSTPARAKRKRTEAETKATALGEKSTAKKMEKNPGKSSSGHLNSGAGGEDCNKSGEKTQKSKKMLFQCAAEKITKERKQMAAQKAGRKNEDSILKDDIKTALKERTYWGFMKLRVIRAEGVIAEDSGFMVMSRNSDPYCVVRFILRFNGSRLWFVLYRHGTFS